MEVEFTTKFYRAILAGLKSDDGTFIRDLTKAQQLVPEYVEARDWYDSYTTNQHFDFEAQLQYIENNLFEDEVVLNERNLLFKQEKNQLELCAFQGIKRSTVKIQHCFKKTTKKEYIGLACVIKMYWFLKRKQFNTKIPHNVMSKTWIQVHVGYCVNHSVWEKFFFILRAKEIKRISTGDVLPKDIVNLFKKDLLTKLFNRLFKYGSIGGSYQNLIQDEYHPEKGSFWGEKSSKIDLIPQNLMKQTLQRVVDVYESQ